MHRAFSFFANNEKMQGRPLAVPVMRLLGIVFIQTQQPFLQELA